MKPARTNTVISLGVMVLALLAIFIWIPLDTASGIIEKVRGRQSIGDALAPTVACSFLFVGGILIFLFERRADPQPTITTTQFGFIFRCTTIIVVGILIMRWTGPILAELVNVLRDEPVEYRLLRATAGWKHVGFVLGGTILVAGLIALVERKLTGRAVLTALGIVALVIVVFDVPFDDLLLPPNGDV